MGEVSERLNYFHDVLGLCLLQSSVGGRIGYRKDEDDTHQVEAGKSEMIEARCLEVCIENIQTIGLQRMALRLLTSPRKDCCCCFFSQEKGVKARGESLRKLASGKLLHLLT
jgi:hypothetical protein